jgi:hypothetical protein
MVMYADGNPVDVLRAFPVLDKPATRVLVERLFPDAVIEEVGDMLLADAFDPPEDVAYVGCFPGLDVVCGWTLMPDRPSQLDGAVAAASEKRNLFLHAVHADADWCSYGRWHDGELVRAVSVCPDPGVIEELGERLDFEEPYWKGEHPADGLDLPFHPLELGAAALRDFFGIVPVAEIGNDDVDPEIIPVVGYRITRTVSADAAA